MTAMPIYGKHIKHLLEPKDQLPWDMVCSIRLLGLYISFEFLTLVRKKIRKVNKQVQAFCEEKGLTP